MQIFFNFSKNCRNFILRELYEGLFVEFICPRINRSKTIFCYEVLIVHN